MIADLVLEPGDEVLACSIGELAEAFPVERHGEQVGEVEHTVVRCLGASVLGHVPVPVEGREARVAEEQPDLVEGLGEPGVGLKWLVVALVGVEEGEIAVNAIEFLIDPLDVLLDPRAVPLRVVVIEVQVAQEHEVGVVTPALLLHAAHNPLHQRIELLPAVGDVVAEVQVGVNRQQLVGRCIGMPLHLERGAERRPDERQERGHLHLELGLPGLGAAVPSLERPQALLVSLQLLAIVG